MARSRVHLASRDPDFQAGFVAAARTAARAAALLDLMLAEHPDHPELPAAIRELEHEGDHVARALLQRLNGVPGGSADREDVLRLTSSLDDVTDLVEEVADLFGLYGIEAPMSQAQELAHLLALACAELAAAMELPRAGDALTAHVAEIVRLEHEGDRVSREAVASLFDAGIDPMVVIRWKDVFERLEEAIDATERTANVLEGLRAQYG